METERVGILGGSFDPLHRGHLELAENARQLFRLSRVLFLLSANPPHKMRRRVLPAERRLEILKSGLEGCDHFSYSALELELPGPSYTFRSHMVLREHYPGVRFFFLIGADSFLQIRTWKNQRELLAQLDFLVFVRSGSETEKIRLLAVVSGFNLFFEKAPVSGEIGVHLFRYRGEFSGISSTMIRRMLKAGQDVSGLLPPSISEIVQKEYRQ